MKKTTLFFILIFIIFQSNAQKVGFQAGCGLQSYQTGLFGEFKIAGPLSLKTTVAYFSSTKKEELVVTDGQGWIIDTDYALLRTSHVIVPIQLKLTMGKATIRPYFTAGVAPCFMLKSVAISSSKTNDISFDYEDHGNYLLDLGEEGTFDHQKKVDISIVSPNIDARLVNSFGLDLGLKKLVPFVEIQLISRLKNNAQFQSKFNLQLVAGIKI